MSYVTWNTPVGRLGTIRELDYNEFALSATDSGAYPIQYKLLSGAEPDGMRVTLDGKVQGVPVILAAGIGTTKTYVFTVRAESASGAIADRTFSILVTNQSTLEITGQTNLGTFDDGSEINFQFHAITENPNAVLTWSVLSGEVPLDIRTNQPLTLTSSGLLTGYISRLLNTSGGTQGYDMEPEEAFPFDFSQQSQDKVYTFKVQVTDGTAIAVTSCIIAVVSKGRFTADNSITVVNNTGITVDADNRYLPVIITDPSTIPTLQAGSRFNFKFDAIDPDGDVVNWSANATIPSGLGLSVTSGWLTGTIPAQTELTKTYTFAVQAYKRDAVTYKSNALAVNIHTVKDASNYITWTTASNVGTIVNGTVSELKIAATSNLGKELTYTNLSAVSGALPPGLVLLPTGEISGRVEFPYFRLDGTSSSIYLADTTGITAGALVSGPGVSSGTVVTQVINSYTLKVSPAIYTAQGTDLIFTMGMTTITRQLTSQSTTTTIDGGRTTFDAVYYFTAQATATDGSASTTRDFSIRVVNYNHAPYENIYLRAMPTVSQRNTFNSIIANTDIFPPALIYRPTDPWFGKATDIRALFLPGLSSEEVSQFANSIQHNHYNKTITFGNIKTARAVDENTNTKYEVVYMELEDDKQYNGVSAALSEEPAITNYYLYGGNSYHTIYPNSFENMQYRLETGVGYSNRGALPSWMTSPQEDGRVLGLIRAVVLAYTVPGASKLIAYRLSTSGINFNDISFVADRYHLDAKLSEHFNPANNQFVPTPLDANNNYAHPEDGYKYIIYPQIGVFR